ncbi:MAG: hypothetical protein EZS28_013454, partial [Streblomastix strix]
MSQLKLFHNRSTYKKCKVPPTSSVRGTMTVTPCQSSHKGDYCSPSPSETLAPPLYFEIAKWAAGTGKRTMTQASGQNAQALFTHLRDGAVLNTIPSQPLGNDRDASGRDTNVFASDREITVTDAGAGPALRTPPMQEIQFFIMRFMELLMGRNAFAIDFLANLFVQAQIRDYKARTLHEPEVIRHAKVKPNQITNNTANSRVDGYIQNFQFQILMLYKLKILQIQHVLEGNMKQTLIDLLGMCAALLRFAEWSTYIRIQMKEGAQGAQQFDPGYNGVISLSIQPLHALRLIQGQGSQDLVNPQAGQYSATAMGPGQQIPQLMAFTPTQIVQQFYSGQLIPRPQIQQPFQGFGIYPGLQQFQGFPQPGLFQQAQPTSGYSHQAQQAIQPFNLVFRARTLNNQTYNIANKQRFRLPKLMQQQQNQAGEPVYINEMLLDSQGTA